MRITITCHRCGTRHTGTDIELKKLGANGDHEQKCFRCASTLVPGTLFKRFNREDLEELRAIIKEEVELEIARHGQISLTEAVRKLESVLPGIGREEVKTLLVLEHLKGGKSLDGHHFEIQAASVDEYAQNVADGKIDHKEEMRQAVSSA